ncbi:MAG: chromate transporter [Acidimicrobiales bacterium]
MTPATAGSAKKRLGEVAWVLAKLGVIGFAGPAAHLALMRQEMVVRRHWLSEQEFLDLLERPACCRGRLPPRSACCWDDAEPAGQG